MSDPDTSRQSMTENQSNPVDRLFQKRKKIHPRFVNGVFQKWRIAMMLFIMVIFYTLPWLTFGDRPLILIDFASRRFYLFNTVFWPQDVIYVTALLIVAAYSLFLFTAIAGRLFCGYACPQTVYTELLMWIERAIEGDRNARIRLDAAPWSASKIAKKSLKHAVWLVVALCSGITFVGYFVPIREVISLLPFGVSGWLLFFIVLFSAMVYGLGGHMREQVCKYMCPYARFQSAMLDRDSMIVTYDQARGEPRGAAKKSDAASDKKGDCVDCNLCVHVCPTGIDIRKGLQYECIGCGACIDACDSVMVKMKKPIGLVRYFTENAQEKGLTRSQMLRRVFRWRTLIYMGILLAIVATVVATLVTRNPLRFDVIRDRGVMAREAAPGVIENVYRLQMMNTEESARRFSVTVEGLDGIFVETPKTEVLMDALEVRMVPVSVRLPVSRSGTNQGIYPITFTVRSTDGSNRERHEKSTFMIPRY
ncbi:MAG: cytochrome c oxidase accessory protein CcoG [Burkholderiales bacterium]|jgi:cytochrome c oxidase accessory protein FixG|nr:cytochrome c oxidase accessory protein CcoG [Burkholderiales bacterium]